LIKLLLKELEDKPITIKRLSSLKEFVYEVFIDKTLVYSVKGEIGIYDREAMTQIIDIEYSLLEAQERAIKETVKRILGIDAEIHYDDAFIEYADVYYNKKCLFSIKLCEYNKEQLQSIEKECITLKPLSEIRQNVEMECLHLGCQKWRST